LSFDAAACVDRRHCSVLQDADHAAGGHVDGWPVAGAGGVVVRADHRRVDPDDPRPTMVAVAAGAQPIPDVFPGAVGRLAAMPVVHRLPLAVRGGQVPPRRAGAGAPQHPVDHPPVVAPLPTTSRAAVGHQRLQQRPLRISQLVSIMHATGFTAPDRQTSGTATAKHALAALLDRAGNMTARLSGKLGSSNLGPVTLEQLELRIAGFMQDFQHTLSDRLFHAVLAQQEQIETFLDGSQPLDQRRQLYRIAGQLSALLGPPRSTWATIPMPTRICSPRCSWPNRSAITT
jgi:hypothetical protein